MDYAPLNYLAFVFDLKVITVALIADTYHILYLSQSDSHCMPSNRAALRYKISLNLLCWPQGDGQSVHRGFIMCE